MNTDSGDSVVMRTWKEYAARINDQKTRARRTPRLDGSNRIYLSAITGCPRKETLRILGYKRTDHSAASLVNMQSGIKGEEKVAVVLEANGYQVTRQYVVQTIYGNGQADIYATHSTLEHPLIVEVKTSTFSRMQYLPQRDHLDQALLYIGFLKLPRAELVYLLKQSHDDASGDEKIVSYVVEHDEIRFNELVTILDAVDLAVKLRQPLPVPSEYESNKSPCEYPGTGRCVYWENCYGMTAVRLENKPMIESTQEGTVEF